MIDERHLFVVAVAILGFIAFQFRKRKDILMCMFAANSTFCIHYLLNTSLSAVVINGISAMHNLLYAQRDNCKMFRAKALPYIFAVMVMVIGVLKWDGPLTILLVAGNVVNCFGMRCKRTTNIRKSILVSAPVLAVYEFFAGTFVGVCFQLLLITSAIIGLVKFRNYQSHR